MDVSSGGERRRSAKDILEDCLKSLNQEIENETGMRKENCLLEIPQNEDAIWTTEENEKWAWRVESCIDGVEERLKLAEKQSAGHEANHDSLYNRSKELEEENKKLREELKRAQEENAKLEKKMRAEHENGRKEFEHESLMHRSELDNLYEQLSRNEKVLKEFKSQSSIAAKELEGKLVQTEQKLQKEIRSREAMEVRLQSSISKEQHEEIVGDLEVRLRTATDRMGSLDDKFKQLWERMKNENGEIRQQAEKLREELLNEKERKVKDDERLKELIRQKKTAEQQTKSMERDVQKLLQLVKSLKEQSQIMKTIARIRTETTRDKQESVGFDALVKTIDNIHKEIERQCTLFG